MTREPCDTCRGEGMVLVSEVNDQYDRTHASYGTCPNCGGEGTVEVEPDDAEDWATIRAVLISGGSLPLRLQEKYEAHLRERSERARNWFQRLADSDKAWAERNR